MTRFIVEQITDFTEQSVRALLKFFKAQLKENPKYFLESEVGNYIAVEALIQYFIINEGYVLRLIDLDSDKIVGYLTAIPTYNLFGVKNKVKSFTDVDTDIHICNIYVLDHMQRSNGGQLLLDSIISIINASKFETMSSLVRLTNAKGFSFHTKNSFKPIMEYDEVFELMAKVL